MGGAADGGAASAAGGREEIGLTTNLGTVAWAAPEMLLAGEGGRGEYTSKVGNGSVFFFSALDLVAHLDVIFAGLPSPYANYAAALFLNQRWKRPKAS